MAEELEVNPFDLDPNYVDPASEAARPEPEAPEVLPPMDVTPLRMDAELLFLTGEAGTGKTTVLHHARKQHPGAIQITATTGVAAMNADAITINSFLGFGTNRDLQYLAQTGRLVNRLRDRCRDILVLVIDEISMFHAGALDILVQAIRELNEEGREVFFLATQEYKRHPLRLVVVGDFGQLPPVDPGATVAPWAFNAQCWKDFEVQRLTKVHRQTDPAFREAIQAARHGNGVKCVRLLQEAGVRFVPYLHDELVTLFSTNNEVHTWNLEKFTRLIQSGGHETQREFKTIRMGKQRQEWSKEILDTLTLCNDCRVRITANDTKTWNYVNGDQGIIEDMREGFVKVRLDRNGRLIELRRVQRFNDVDGDMARELAKQGETVLWRTIYDDEGNDYEIPYIGSVNYLPVKYGWASTVHSVQGLSLESLQISPGHKFFGSPNLAYVALSRAKKAEGLLIHGTPEQLAKRIVAAKEAKPWM